MKTNSIVVVGAVLIAGLCFGAGELRSQEKDKGKGGAEGMSPEQAEAMKAWEKAGAVGEHHAHLKPMAGRFDAVAKFYMDPSHPTESKGVSENEMVLGGRFLEQRYKGDFMGMPFEGRGLTGYNNLKQKYTAIWVDNTYTGVMTSEGTCTDGGKTMNFESNFDDPMTGKPKKSRAVIKIESNDKHSYEAHEVGEDGKEHKVMEITYTRAGGAKK